MATGRLQYLLEAGAIVTLIAPREGLSDEVLWRIEEEKRAEGGGEIRWKDRVWSAEEDEATLGGECERKKGSKGRKEGVLSSTLFLPSRSRFWFLSDRWFGSVLGVGLGEQTLTSFSLPSPTSPSPSPLPPSAARSTPPSTPPTCRPHVTSTSAPRSVAALSRSWSPPPVVDLASLP